MNPILQIIDIIGGLGEKYFASKEAKAEFQSEVSKALLENQAKLNESMAQVMSADAQSEGWLTRNIRPFTVANMLVLLNAIVATAIISPEHVEKITEALGVVPDQLWYVILGGIGLYSVLKTGEKSVRKLLKK